MRIQSKILVFLFCLFIPITSQAVTADYSGFFTRLSDSWLHNFLYDCGGLVDVCVKGNIAYTIDDFYGLQIFDYSDPLGTARRGIVYLPRWLEHCDIWDHYVYVITTEDKIEVVDVDDHDTPVHLNTILVGADPLDLLVAGPWLYVSTAEGPIQIYSLASATEPALVGSFNAPSGPASRLTLDSSSLVVAGDLGLSVFSLAVPTWPGLLGSTAFTGATKDLSALHGLAAVGQLNQTRLLDFSDPAAIQQLSLLPDTGQGVLLTENGQLLLGFEDCWNQGGMRVYDVVDPANPVWLWDDIRGFRGAPRAMVEKQGLIFAAEHMCWCAGEWPGFHVFQSGSLPLPEALSHTYLEGALGFIERDNAIDFATRSGLHTLEFSDPMNPRLAQTYDSESLFYIPVAWENQVAVITGTLEPDFYYFQMLDYSPEGTYQARGSLPISDYPNLMAFADDLALMTADRFGNGLIPVDVSDPDDLILLPELFPGQRFCGMALHGHLAVLCIEQSTALWDFSDPTNPVMLSVLEEENRRGRFRFMEREGHLLLLTSDLNSSSSYYGGRSKFFLVDDPQNPQLLTGPPIMSQFEEGPTSYSGSLLILTSSSLLSYFRWDDVLEPPVFLGRQPVSGYGPYKGPAAVMLDECVVYQNRDGTVTTWPIPEAALSGVDEPSPLPKPLAFQIKAFPNPFNPSCRIGFSLPADGPVQVEIFDTQGRRIKTLLQAAVRAGDHHVTWHGQDEEGHSVATGLYLARVSFQGVNSTIKLTLAK